MPSQIHWSESTGMIGGGAAKWLGIALAIVSAAAGTLLAYEQALPKWLVILCSVLLAVAGAVGGAIGVHTQRRRIAKGQDPTAPEPEIEGSPRRGSGLIAGVIALVLVAGAASQACRPITPDQRNTGDLVAGLSCAAVGLVCGSGVLPASAQRWCSVAMTACGGARATVVAVLDELVYEPGPHSTSMMLFARPPDLILASEWAAVCAATEDAYGYEVEGLACGVVLDALSRGAETVTVPIFR